MSNTLAPYPLILTRANKTFLVMTEIQPTYQAPNFMSPNNYNDLITAVINQENEVSLKAIDTSAAAGDLDLTLDPWHDDSVLTLKVGRINFAATKFAPTWNRMTANGQSRERILSEGNELARAWQKSNALWTPKPGKTLAAFQALQTAADTKFKAWKNAILDEEGERGQLWLMADNLWELSVQWYEMAAAAFNESTPEGILIRTIPTSYDPNRVPGQLRFTEFFAPAPSQVKLEWSAARGKHFNIYAKARGRRRSCPSWRTRR